MGESRCRVIPSEKVSQMPRCEDPQTTDENRFCWKKNTSQSDLPMPNHHLLAPVTMVEFPQRMDQPRPPEREKVLKRFKGM